MIRQVLDANWGGIWLGIEPSQLLFGIAIYEIDDHVRRRRLRVARLQLGMLLVAFGVKISP